jgi:sec-independent protein translocase protein TatA
MMGIGFPELMIILVIIMIIFGAGKLPEIGNAFGRSIKNFKTSMKEAQDEESGDQVAQAEGGDTAELPNPENTPATTEEEVTAQLGGSHPKAATPSPSTTQSTTKSTTKSVTATSKPAPQKTATQAKTAQGKPKGKGERVKSEEEKMIEDAIKELKDKRIGTIRTPHDGLVQQNDVFTESVKRNPWGSGRGKGVRRDVM